MATSAPPSNPADFSIRLNTLLSQIQVPVLYDSAWIGPFEQLMGAVFSLIESEKRDFSRREYSGHITQQFNTKLHRSSESFKLDEKHTTGRSEQLAVSLLLQLRHPRINFAAERLIATFAALPCNCGNRPPEIAISNNRPPKFKERLKGAHTRLAHVESECASSLTNFKAVLCQLAAQYEREIPLILPRV